MLHLHCRLLLAAVCIGCSAAAVSPAAESAISDIKKEIEANARKIDPDDPPYYDASNIIEPTCINNIISCLKTEFWTRQYLDHVDSVSIQTSVHTDAELVNTGSKDATIRSTESTAVALGTTKGWTIGLKASAGVTGGVAPLVTPFTAELSGSYKDETTSTTTETRTTQYTASCPPGKTCRIQTVTYQVTATGVCSDEPFYNCGGEQHMCTSDWTESCDQYNAFFKKGCKSIPTVHPCKVNIQMRDNGDKLLNTVIITES